jgi:hypothetical protein
MSATPLQHIDEPRLERDLAYRFGYVAGFMGFGRDDIDAIHAMAPYLAPLVPALVDAVYVKLFNYDATKRHFVPRQSGYEGEVPASLETLTLEHEQIKFRKGHLAAYLKKLVTGEYDEKMVGYLDFVGKIHTPRAGSKEIEVPLVQMNALMGFVSDALLATILSLDLDDLIKHRAVRAFNKLLWLQNDLITRHYAASGSGPAANGQQGNGHARQLAGVS